MRQGKIASPKARLCELILSKIGPLRENAHILDIGGGEGFFVEQALRAYKNVKVTLVEPQAEERMMTLERVKVHRKLVEDWLQTTPAELYDVIVAMDLVEHLRNPLEVMAKIITTRLRPGGTIILTTPDAASRYRRLLGPFWPHYKVEHLTYPSKGALSKLAETACLDVRECSSFGKPLPLGYIITVLKNFGPATTRALGRIVDLLVPTSLRGLHVCIPSGELLLHATKTVER